MRVKRTTCAVLLGMVLLNGLCGGAQAAEALEADQGWAEIVIVERATNEFNMTISAKKVGTGSITLPLKAGDIVTVNAAYSPSTASVDVGLIDSDGMFHYVNITGGVIDVSIQVKEAGNYRLGIRNNSGYSIKATGYVDY
ncbi:hypothetical protein [Pseudoflavonifractor sp. HCP28S3_F10]|uniref:hypothetical protein n=1 Tax=Pseudoflavonifractor sp. HCP28S3_F10 TaxID=3438947 RepID=UPI003F8BA6CC